MPIDSYMLKALNSRPDTPRKYEADDESDGVRSDGTDLADEDATDDPECHEGHYAAAKEMMDAHSKGDHEGYAHALKNFMDMSKK